MADYAHIKALPALEKMEARADILACLRFKAQRAGEVKMRASSETFEAKAKAQARAHEAYMAALDGDGWMAFYGKYILTGAAQ